MLMFGREDLPVEEHSLKVLDSRGDTELRWKTDDAAAMAIAQEAFAKAKKEGQVFRASPNGEGGGQMKEFDPRADMIGVKAIQGG